jgi:outer membrane receptor for ferric coprogen and ferric-rhodotorulic acid
VSVITNQQMKDQNLTQLTDVVSQAAGLTINQTGNIGSDNSPVYARGQTVDNYLLDGVKLMSSYSSIFKVRILLYLTVLKLYVVPMV